MEVVSRHGGKYFNSLKIVLIYWSYSPYRGTCQKIVARKILLRNKSKTIPEIFCN